MSAALLSTLWVLDTYGPVAPTTLTPPVRQGLGKYGDGLFIEEGTTNLFAGDAQVPALNLASGDTSGTDVTRGKYSSRGSTKVTKGAASGDFTNCGAIAVTFPSAGTYTVSMEVWASAESGTLLLDASSYVGSTGEVSPAIAAGSYGGRWVQIYNTVTIAAGDLVGNYTIRTSLPAAPGTTFNVTAVQIEAKAYPTSYADGSLGTGYTWTGAAWASTSTRAAGAYVATLPGALPPALTLVAWVRVGSANTAGTRGIASLSAAAGRTPSLLVASGSVQFSSQADVAATLSIATVPGDLLFLAGVLAADGKTYTLYASKNGAAVTSNTTTLSASAYTSATTLTVGNIAGGSSYLDGITDSILLYNAALTSGEINALAASADEKAFKDDPRIVLGVAGGTVRGTTNAETTAGTGLYRGNRTVASFIEPLTATTASPDDDTSTHKITVPAGSGIGAGQSVAYQPDGPTNTRYTVDRAFTPGGDYDELFVTAA